MAGEEPMNREGVVRVRIEGRVQGVCFRAWTVEQARSRSLRGWVRNRSDGTVEAVFAGAQEAIDDMVSACRRGPPAAAVNDIRRRPASEVDLEATGFRQLPTA